jgi:hypothetical protein
MHLKGISIFSRFSKNITRFVLAELDLAIDARQSGDINNEFKHLENAHVLGQESTYWHVKVHMLMLLWALRNYQLKECFGQLFRIVGAALTTAFGLVPQGNTGGSNVSPFKVMPIEHEYQIIISDAKSDD